MTLFFLCKTGETATTYHFKTLVPSVAAGAIIGKGGETIASLQKDAGARVKMSKSHDFYPGKRVTRNSMNFHCSKIKFNLPRIFMGFFFCLLLFDLFKIASNQIYVSPQNILML